MSEGDLENFIRMTKLKTIEFLQFGETTIETWYHSDFPKEYHNRILYTCPFCLNFFISKRELESHSERCEVRCPPGDEIYRDRDDQLSVFEFDAKQQKVYTENLCYIAKLFLDHKNIQSEIEAFYFYILCEHKEDGYYPVGYFSKEKDSEQLNNLSCIMVFPPWQRCGYGKFIIDFSYQLSKIERKQGTPERPLSDLGHRTYVSYWTNRILHILIKANNEQSYNSTSIQNIADETGILPQDITYILESYEILRCQNGKYFMFTEMAHLETILTTKGRAFREVKPDKIHWVPNNYSNTV